MAGIKLNDFSENANLANTSYALAFGSNFNNKIKLSDMYWAMCPDGSGAHNAYGFRGKNLGTTITDAQYAEIKSGRFRDMFLGDYWTPNGHKYVIADFNYRYRTGDNSDLTKQHLLLVPDTMSWGNDGTKTYQLVPDGKTTMFMNTTNTTAGGYVGSLCYTKYLPQVVTTLQDDFGSKLLTYRNYLSNGVDSNGLSNAGAWYDRQCDLLTQTMVYGSPFYSNNPTATWNDSCVDHQQLSLARIRKDYFTGHARNAYWLRDIVSSGSFAAASDRGYARWYGASGPWYGVRAFCLIG